MEGNDRVMDLKPLCRFPVTAPVTDMLEAFDADGGLVVEGMVEQPVIDAIRETADLHAEGVVPGSADQGMGEDGALFVGRNTKRFSSLGLLTDAFFDLLENKTYTALADAVLLPNCGSYDEHLPGYVHRPR